ncbi:DNA polymerase III subunit alpha [Rhizobium pusense]|jgi:DNA polymerase-3 subunit alpha|uniref:DNA polymerase III subunit alpha n=3 Tax=Agrobacterium TaxID=357 RepID=A0A1L9CUV3_9HYPH|nr:MULTISPECIES: DNA polymerase III subunit alpha [Rhizobium/Agrobacterium group]ANV22695.1 DNA polymerase III subunit alpha [Rhizobium sp. S41]AUC09544.1 DNA polymerase III subunit alpha [Rhizobium sp. Y9]KGE84606.1 DNA polymerase III subunit alpha [Rhizobium sp. H41]KIV69155.1 DNA polymerase III alpha subunit [Rhizobium sp. UR51a]MBB2904812.1 DNA polymerase-3 subunit alpha [Rhizobium sp. RAS22]MDP9733014.1 DNA polymerase-3 subunit alpha [Rhizobium sp. SORGH_AS_0285]MDP9755156.1 DNA polymer
MGDTVVRAETSDENLNTPGFVHLRVHSAYSLLEGALPLKKIMSKAVSDGQPAIAITDTNNLFVALEFSEKARDEGLQPIIGCQLSIDMQDAAEDRRNHNSHLQKLPAIVLLAADAEGYERLVDLVSRAYLEGEGSGHSVHITRAWLEEDSNAGLIALTGASGGPVDMALREGHAAQAKERLLTLKSLFGDRLYIELQRQSGYDRSHERRMIGLAYDHDIPLVATNEAFFPSKADYEAHDALMAVAHNAIVSDDSRFRLTPDHYLKSREEMTALFADLPEALDNTVEIALRCSYVLKKRGPILPRFTGASDDPEAAERAEAEELRRQAVEGLDQRLAALGMAPGYTEQDYRERLDFELGVISRMKFPGYFLIVADFIKWAKQHDIPVGPGRGSGAGSLVAYALTITDVDPLRFSLLFERFLNPERVSMPDFDIDFCQDRREEVIRYVQAKYGREQVAQIITFGSLQARAALRDVGRVLEMPYGQVDKICKLVPNNPANPTPLSKAIEEEPRLQEEADREPVVARLLDIAQKIEGLYRHASTHAAGIVIGDRPLSKLVPMYRDPRSDMPVTQFNMKWVESAGLVKFDFLGLKTLTVLKVAVDFVAKRGIKVDLAAIPLDDAKTYEMLSRGETIGVFQVESAGMRKALIGMRPDCIEDIIALVALYRPGPMENIPVYNARKHGEEELESIHPTIDHLLKETQGVIVYQEQVMQIAQVLSGYSLGEADLLRRAMGKKIKEEMDKQRERFVDGAIKNGVSKPQADTIFDLLAKFANYGFNKSHAAAYAIVSYQTAYMKAHYPVEFLAASMTLDMANTEKLNDFRQDAGRLGIEIVAPSVQTSFRQFETGENRIYYSLAAIKGVGEGAVEHIVAIRGDKPFTSLEDFCLRIDPKQINRRVLESLINAGAFDCFGRDRAELIGGLDRIIGYAQMAQNNRTIGQSDMFGSGGGNGPEKLVLPAFQPWLASEKLLREYQVLGFYLTAHPLDTYRPVLEKLRVQNFADFSAAVKQGATAGRLAGTVTGKQERKTRTGNKMGIVTFSDASGQYEAVLFSEGLGQYRDLLEVGKSLVITVQAEERPEGIGLRIQTAQSLEEKSVQMQKALRVYVRDSGPLKTVARHLNTRGDGSVYFIVIKDEGSREIEVELTEKYRISPEIAAALRSAPGVVDVELV